MCAVSMIYDYYYDKWNQPIDVRPQPDVFLPAVYIPPPQYPSDEEIAEFRRLLDRAREYDKKYNQPDCEMEEKVNLLLQLAAKLGVEDQIRTALNNAKGECT